MPKTKAPALKNRAVNPKLRVRNVVPFAPPPGAPGTGGKGHIELTVEERLALLEAYVSKLQRAFIVDPKTFDVTIRAGLTIEGGTSVPGGPPDGYGIRVKREALHEGQISAQDVVVKGDVVLQ